MSSGGVRTLFLEAAENDDPIEFLGYIDRHHCKDDDFSIEDLLEGFARKQYDKLWTGLYKHCTTTFLDSPFENGDKETIASALKCLQAIITVGKCCLEQDKPVVSDNMLETVVILHGVLLDLPEVAHKVQINIANLCQTWWTKEIAGREELTANTIMYLLVKSIQPNGTRADVRAVCSMRQVLEQINIEDDSSTALTDLLERCVITPAYLKFEVGRRFLVMLFGLNMDFIEKLHKAIKNQLPNCPNAMVDFYGEIYFKAWRAATGPAREKIETHCIQDLMFHAVHAPRVGSRSLASILRKLLGYFATEKRQQGVDKMLLDLYQPILWRTVKVANSAVRANAASLLIEAFPLQDPEANREDTDALMQKQIDILDALLMDPCPTVRVIAVQGICRISNLFWELIPVHTLQAFMTKLIQEMVFDASSSNVRAAVFQGLNHLLDNHLSHPILKTLLPLLKDFIHDTSVTVRLAFVELLLKLKGLRTMKIWHIVPMENILAQMVDDTPPVTRRIVSLLFNSFQPTDADGEVQLTRTVALIQTNQAAARVFYQHAHRHMSIVTAGKFMVLLGKCILGCVRQAQQPFNAGEKGQGDAGSSQDESQDDDQTLTLKDDDVMEGMLEIIAILWAGINSQLSEPVNQSIHQKLVSRFGKAVPEFLMAFDDGRALQAVTMIAGFLPSASIPAFSRTCISKLKTILPSTPPEDFGPVAESVVSWGRGAEILELANDWLMATFQMKQDDSSEDENQPKKKVSFAEPIDAQPEVALKLLDFILARYPLRTTILTSCELHLKDLMATLQKAQECLEKKLAGGTLSAYATDEVIVETIQMYCRFQIHFAARDMATNQSSSELCEVLTNLMNWSDIHLVPTLRNDAEQTREEESASSVANLTSVGNTTFFGKRRRLPNIQRRKPHYDLAKDAMKVVLVMLNEATMLGLLDLKCLNLVADFSQVTLKADCSLELIPLSFRLLYLISQQNVLLCLQEKGQGEICTRVPDLLNQVIKTIVEVAKEEEKKPFFVEDESDVKKTLTECKQSLSEVTRIYFAHPILQAEGVLRDIVASMMAACLAEISSKIDDGKVVQPCSSIAELPMVSAFLLASVCRTQALIGVFISELEQCTSSGAVPGIHGILAVLHILHALAKGKKKAPGIKDCLTAVQKELSTQLDVKQEKDTSQDGESPLYTEAEEMCKEISQVVGMVV